MELQRGVIGEGLQEQIEGIERQRYIETISMDILDCKKELSSGMK